MFRYKIRRRISKREMQDLMLRGSRVYEEWFDALPDMKSDEQMAGIARQALPILSTMNDYAHQCGWKGREEA